MTPSKKAKELGCKSLAQVSVMTKQSEQTLINWFNNPNKQVLFEIVCIGVASKAGKENEQARQTSTDVD